jgi:hypothetical protein
VADEVWRLQRGEDEESRFFQSFADRGHYRAEGGSRQGIYAVTPGGRLLASANELDPERLCELLRGALDAWEALPESERADGAPPRLDTGRRPEDSCPTDGLVLVETFRDVPRDFEPGTEPLRPSNRDYAWFSAEEARGLVESGPEGALPFVRRLARFHFVDSVRGQSLPFAEQELRRLVLRVVNLGEEEGRVRLELTGATEAVARGPWLMGPSDWKPDREYPRSVETELRGRAVWDRRRSAFVEFELVAIGTRTGFTRFNGRSGDPGRSPIGFHLTLAGPGVRVPPAFADVYDADWLAPAGAGRE